MKISDFFKEDKSEINALLKLKLKLNPKWEMEILEDHCKDASGEYVSIVQNWKGKIIERVFSCRLYKSQKEYQEVIRRIEGNSLIGVKNMYYSRMGGYRTVWKNSHPSQYYFNEPERNIWFSCSMQYYNVYSSPLFDLQDLIEADVSLQYCAWDKQPIIDYVTIYRKYPELEILSKLKLNRLMYNTKCLEKLKERSFKKFLFKCGANSGVAGREILYCYNHKLNYSQYLQHKKENERINRAKKDTKKILEEYPALPKQQLFKYLKEKDISAFNYLDLLKAEVYLHLDLTLEKNIFPHDFMYWHDFYTKQMSDSENKEIDLKIKEQADRYKKLAKKIDGVKLVFPKATSELIIEGERLNHCVGRMGYNKKIAEDESLILFVRKDEEEDKPFVTMEYDPHKKKVLQLYAVHDTQPEETIKEIIYNKWLPKVKRLKFA